ncbi:MAG: thymidine phosphorylase [Eubacterium sp.]|nr:thymidine phosphorylase [Eubacterium sp.]
MRMYDIIDKKKRGEALTDEEIEFFVKGFTEGEIPDYQVSALLMAICLKGMNEEETTKLTMTMMESGDVMDLSDIPGLKLDKHSTGGIGDKTTLVVEPVMAALGGKVAKMSGRGLGATGGTIDKLDSIPGFSSELTEEAFINQVKEIGMVDAAQTKNLVPADKKLYSLRDVTATVDSISLIASSIMSKKLASGADVILLDVKCGSGAFMREYESAEMLAETMIKIGNNCGRRTAALITDMDQPLGHAVGNSLEVLEAVEVLKGCGEERLTEICRELCAYLYIMSDISDEADEDKRWNEAYKAIDEVIASGKALDKFRQFVKAQGGDDSFVDDPSKLKQPLYKRDVYMDKDGYLESCDATKVGMVSCILGAGRVRKEDSIDSSAGIIINKKLGDRISKDEVFATLYTDKEDILDQAEADLIAAYNVSDNEAEARPVVIKRI